MNHFYDWKDEYYAPFVAIISASIGFAAYWFLSISPKIKSYFFNGSSKKTAWMSYIFFQKMTGLFLMGIIPGIIICSTSTYSLSDLGLNINNFKESLYYIAIMGILIVSINYFAAKKPFNLVNYPQMRLMRWTKKRLAFNSFVWAAYLLGYEFLFRGILLFICYQSFGFWPAVAINLLFYSATHILKGLAETIGAFPYGLLLCFITISTGSIAVAFITHLILALSNDYFAVYHNPEMTFK